MLEDFFGGKLRNPPITGEMTVRRIMLADGRYMIFYMFSNDISERQNTQPGREEEASPPPQTERGSRV